MSVDIQKLDKALQRIAEHPEEWRQGSWGRRAAGCGTAGCLAYHVGVVDGAEIRWSDEYDGQSAIAGVAGVHPSTYAQRALGLTDEQADNLFHGGNDMAVLRAMRDALADDPGASLNGFVNEEDEDDDEEDQ